MFFLVVTLNSESHYAEIANAIYPPLGCPSIHTAIDWAQWVPGRCRFLYLVRIYSFWEFIATVYEGILFIWVAKKTLQSMIQRDGSRNAPLLYSIIVRDNILYFLGCVYQSRLFSIHIFTLFHRRIACILVSNTLMVAVRQFVYLGRRNDLECDPGCNQNSMDQLLVSRKS